MNPCQQMSINDLKTQLIFRDFLNTFCFNLSPEFYYYLFFVYDYDDPCLSDTSARHKVQHLMMQIILTKCPTGLVKGLYFIPCSYRGNPAWSQSDAMQAAYGYNISYFYRLVNQLFKT